ncbi:MAG: lytic transglycosylase [Deltaproteobacteria bacterium]|nr:lytic transglycosylase [Deltaproteobacteria bacterium]
MVSIGNSMESVEKGAVISIMGFSVILAWAVVLTWASCAGSGTIYFYKDEHGGLHFTDLPTSDKFQPYITFGEAKQLDDRKFARVVSFYSERHDLDEALVHAVIEVESGYRSDAVSSAGAQGLMQIMPDTQKDLGLKRPFDPEENIDAGIRYLKMMLTKFQDIPLALAAYNAGPTNVEKYRGIPPFQETKNYVKKVMHIYNRIKGQG